MPQHLFCKFISVLEISPGITPQSLKQLNKFVVTQEIPQEVIKVVLCHLRLHIVQSPQNNINTIYNLSSLGKQPVRLGP